MTEMIVWEPFRFKSMIQPLLLEDKSLKIDVKESFSSVKNQPTIREIQTIVREIVELSHNSDIPRITCVVNKGS